MYSLINNCDFHFLETEVQTVRIETGDGSLYTLINMVSKHPIVGR